MKEGIYMTLQQFEVFVQVAKTGSFTKAGENLSLTQSAISHVISSFENELGFKLLYRNRSGISITTEGKRIFEHALGILNKTELMKQEAKSILGIESGVLKVGCFPSASCKILPDIILNYETKYPKIELKIFEGNYDEIEEWVINGTVDLGFSASCSKNLNFIPLWKDNLVAIVKKDHPLSLKKSISIKEIQEEPYIMPKSGCDLLIKDIFKENSVEPNIRFEIEDNNAILAMVSRGLGISIVPEMVLSFNSFELDIIKITPNYFRTIGILLKAYDSASPAAVAFIKELKKEIEN